MGKPCFLFLEKGGCTIYLYRSKRARGKFHKSRRRMGDIVENALPKNARFAWLGYFTVFAVGCEYAVK